MPQQQPIIGVDMTQQDYNNLQQQGMLPQQLNQQPQVVDVSPQNQQPIVGNAGAQKTGVDWRGALSTLGSYLNATGAGMAGAQNLSQGLAQGMGGLNRNMQNIRQYDTMKPYYQQMGYDVNRLDPRRGGAGIATTPAEMVDLQSKIAERDYLNDYRQTMAQARAAQAQQTAGTKGVTIGTLRMMSPLFKKMIDAQYGFGSGQNLKLLDQIVPASLVQGYMPAVTKTSNMVYSGGLHSSQNKTGRSDTYHHSNGGSGKGKGKGKPNAHTW